MVTLRPGQRILNIPAIGVQASRRAVASGEVDWSQWLTYAWIFKGAASQVASYADVVSAQMLTAGVAPTWNATDGLVCDGTQWLDTGVPCAPNPGRGRYDRSIIVQTSGASYPNVSHSILGVANNAARQLAIGKYYVGTYFNGADFQPGGQLGASGIYAIDSNGLAYKDGVYLGTGAGFGAFEYASGTIYIGAANAGGAAFYYIGNIQFVGIRTSAWTPTEIADLTAAIAAL